MNSSASPERQDTAGSCSRAESRHTNLCRSPTRPWNGLCAARGTSRGHCMPASHSPVSSSARWRRWIRRASTHRCGNSKVRRGSAVVLPPGWTDRNALMVGREAAVALTTAVHVHEFRARGICVGPPRTGNGVHPSNQPNVTSAPRRSRQPRRSLSLTVNRSVTERSKGAEGRPACGRWRGSSTGVAGRRHRGWMNEPLGRSWPGRREPRPTGASTRSCCPFQLVTH